MLPLTPVAIYHNNGAFKANGEYYYVGFISNQLYITERDYNIIFGLPGPNFPHSVIYGSNIELSCYEDTYYQLPVKSNLSSFSNLAKENKIAPILDGPPLPSIFISLT